LSPSSFPTACTRGTSGAKALSNPVQCGTAKAVPFVDQRNSKSSLPFGQQQIYKRNLILLGLSSFKEINRLHRQKTG